MPRTACSLLTRSLPCRCHDVTRVTTPKAAQSGRMASKLRATGFAAKAVQAKAFALKANSRDLAFEATAGDEPTQADGDHHASQMNPNNDAHQGDRDNRANQMDLNNDAYYRSRGGRRQ
ncbi:hypothetical protein CYMTET_13047 [Cymbomonas tetramitiformis]|uniref:Uncharacterized protein n=1 Tax=Cymbomonas tetramitiformis TaxID=36881 RepID=A0AAE0GJG8_9CHLO|nr:hypothetical protein CYMTET_13047 [Cymbomonas tetramitiformis]